MVFLAGASTLLTLFLGLEWFSISLYILCAIDRDLAGSLEAGLKYLIIGGFGSAMLLFGSALVYGATGPARVRARSLRPCRRRASRTTRCSFAGLALIIGGLGLQVLGGAVPHVDAGRLRGRADPRDLRSCRRRRRRGARGDDARARDGRSRRRPASGRSRSPSIACASLAVGNLAALVQTGIKRMLRVLVDLPRRASCSSRLPPTAPSAGRALLYYLIPYSAMSVGSFAVVAARERELNRPVTIDNLAGLGWERTAARHLDGDLHARLRRLPADRRLRRQVLRLRRARTSTAGSGS
jgi:NADH-quinone oxidoreductase subunit N